MGRPACALTAFGDQLSAIGQRAWVMLRHEMDMLSGGRKRPRICCAAGGRNDAQGGRMLRELHKSFGAPPAHDIHKRCQDNALWRMAWLHNLHLCNSARLRKDARECCAGASAVDEAHRAAAVSQARVARFVNNRPRAARLGQSVLSRGRKGRDAECVAHRGLGHIEHSCPRDVCSRSQVRRILRT
jgi:hypothetical protein